MYRIRFMGLLLIISAILLLSMGCRPDGSPSHPQGPNVENKKETVEVTVGGKVWNIKSRPFLSRNRCLDKPQPTSPDECRKGPDGDN